MDRYTVKKNDEGKWVIIDEQLSQAVGHEWVDLVTRGTKKAALQLADAWNRHDLVHKAEAAAFNAERKTWTYEQNLEYEKHLD